MDKETRKALLVPIKEHKKPGAGGRQFSYVKGEDVIGRLNSVFKNEWSSKIIQHWVSEGPPKQVVVLVELTASGIVHQGFGGADIAVYRDGHRKGEVIDISNSYKGAFTNAIKNAAKQFGIGLLSPETESFLGGVEDAPVLHNAPPTPSAAPTQPISSSTAVMNTKTVPTTTDTSAQLQGIDIKTIQKQLEAMQQEAARTNSEVKNTTAEINNSSNKSTGYDPKKLRLPETVNPFAPPVSGNETINDIQLNALSGLAKMKKVTQDKAIKLGLPDTNKTKYDQLTRDEAKVVIKALNSLG